MAETPARLATRGVNRYLLMRHGQSQANVAGLIISDPATGTQRYGLTEKGRNQVRATLGQYSGPGPSAVYSSDFLRARETADLAAEGFGIATVTLRSELRERRFGALEGNDSSHYQEVWRQDQDDTANPDPGIESVYAVSARVSALIHELEQRHHGETLLLVSHGDTLQILQTLFADTPANRHRDLPHLQLAEIRALEP